MELITENTLVERTSLQSDCHIALPNGVEAFLTVYGPDKTNGYSYTLTLCYTLCDATNPQKAYLGSFPSVQEGLDFTNRMLDAVLTENPRVIFGLEPGETK